MMEMETMDLYEGSEELSLFGREQLLMSLGSPLEPDLSSLFPDDGGVTTATGLLVKEIPPSLVKVQELGTSNVVETLPFKTPDHESGLDMSWLDTKLNLFDFVDGSNHNNAESEVFFINPSDEAGDVAVSQAPTSTLAAEPTAEDLFNQISLGLTLPETSTGSTSSIVMDDGSMLSDVFNKLTSDIELMVREDNMTIPDFGTSVLSPVSVDDIESLLSGPVSPANSSTLYDSSTPMDSGLESLMSTRPNSPQYTDYTPTDIDNNSDSDYLPPVKHTTSKSRKRTTPYSRSSPADKKERKKQQNKNAALKYRQKKKGETLSLDDQCSLLETKNKSLKDKVESMTREIQYLKDLMSEVVKAKQTKLTTST